MFTFLPYGGMYMSPFGYRYYTPMTVGRVYYRPAPVMGYSSAMAGGPSYGGPPYTGATGQQSAVSGAHGGIGASSGHSGGFFPGSAAFRARGRIFPGGGDTGGGGVGAPVAVPGVER